MRASDGERPNQVVQSGSNNPAADEAVRPRKLPKWADVVIIGGGIIGVLTAIELAQRGVCPVVLEAVTPGAGQSSRSMGFVRQQGRDVAELDLMALASDLWSELADDIGPSLGLVRDGQLMLAESSVEARALRSWVDIAGKRSIAAEVLESHELQERFPWLLGEWRLGTFTPGDAQLEPSGAMQAFTAHAARLGVVFVPDCRVLDIEVSADSVKAVVSAYGSIATKTVVVACGLWTGRLLRPLGIRLHQHAGIVTMAATNPVHPITRSCVWAPGGLGFRQTSDGRLILGFGGQVDVPIRWEELADARRLIPLLVKHRKEIRLRPERKLLNDVRRILGRQDLPGFAFSEAKPSRAMAHQLMPATHEMISGLPRGTRLERVWTGTIDATPDFLPIVGKSNIDGLIVAAGFNGHGTGIAPAIARCVGGLVSTGKSPLNLDPFRMDRFDRRPRRVNA